MEVGETFTGGFVNGNSVPASARIGELYHVRLRGLKPGALVWRAWVVGVPPFRRQWPAKAGTPTHGYRPNAAKTASVGAGFLRVVQLPNELMSDCSGCTDVRVLLDNKSCVGGG